MNEKQKVVYLPDFRVKQKKEYPPRWKLKTYPLYVFRVPLGIVIVIVVILGVVFQARNDWQTAAISWLFAFWLMFIFWALEYSAHKAFDLYKTED